MSQNLHQNFQLFKKCSKWPKTAFLTFLKICNFDFLFLVFGFDFCGLVYCGLNLRFCVFEGDLGAIEAFASPTGLVTEVSSECKLSPTQKLFFGRPVHHVNKYLLASNLTSRFLTPNRKTPFLRFAFGTPCNFFGLKWSPKIGTFWPFFDFRPRRGPYPTKENSKLKSTSVHCYNLGTLFRMRHHLDHLDFNKLRYDPKWVKICMDFASKFSTFQKVVKIA